MFTTKYFIAALFLLTPFLSFSGGEGEGQGGRQFVTFGTGGVTGVYYPVGGAIARIISNNNDNIRATSESTGGSVFNINAVLSGDLTFGIAQSDLQYAATNGIGKWEDSGVQSDLRSVFSMHDEAITLIATVDSGITEIMDLVDKRVNLGNAGSGQLENARDLFEAFNISEDSLRAEFVKASEAPALLQDGRIDAFFYTVGHPNGAITESTSGRAKVRLVSITGQPVVDLIQQWPFYARSVIPQTLYPQAANTEDTTTVGLKATLVTSANVPADIVYIATKTTFDNLDDLRTLHPALNNLTVTSMLSGLSAPLHEGALRYFDEKNIAVPSTLRN